MDSIFTLHFLKHKPRYKQTTIKLFFIVNILLFSLMTTSAYCENLLSSVKRFSLRDGLPDTTIYSIVQDKTGFIWLGTPSGLVRYDGYEFRRYSNDVNSTYPLVFYGAGNIFIDSKDRLWIGTWGDGLAVYSKEMKLLGKYAQNDLVNSNSDSTISNSTTDSTVNTTVNLPISNSTINSSIQSNKIQTFFEDSDGDIWVGTNGGGLALFIPETNSFKNYLFDENKPDSISHNRIWSIAESQPGILWVATSDGLNKFDKNKEVFTRYYHDPSNPTSLNHALIRTLHVVKNSDKTDTLWVGTEKGLGIFDPISEKFQAINPKNAPINHTTTKIIQDSHNHLWIGTKMGLYKYDLNNKKFVTLSNENDYRLFDNDDIRDMYIDFSGLLWLATRRTGLIKVDLKPNQFENLYQYQNQSKDKKIQNLSNIQAVYIDSSNVLWLGSKDGVFYRNNNTGIISRFMPSNKLTHEYFKTITENKSGELWLGGLNGLYKIDKQRKTITTQNKFLEKIKLKSIKTLMFDKDDNL
ncbi:MAG: hypothetical protein HRT38_18765, partial [Alteromonadaceae bacterium]|nr:hypothetical protein [Alteromonadaceae bacterium]